MLGQAVAVDLVVGHFEMQIDYANTPGAPDLGWRASVSYDEDGNFNDAVGLTRLDPDTVNFILPPATRTILPANTPVLGPAGSPLWILPQNQIPGQLFLGWRAIYQPGLFQARVGGNYTPSPLGSISSELVSVTGSGVDRGGHFLMWTSTGFGLDVHFSTRDGIGQNDLLEPIPAGSHSHYFWGCSQPGSYAVTFRYFGRLNPNFGGHDTSSEQTYHFKVPFPGFLDHAAATLHLGSDLQQPAALFDPALNVEYAPNRAPILAREIPDGDAIFPFATRLTLRADAPPAPARVGLAGSQAVAFPPGTPINGNGFEILGVDGPGTLDLIPETSGTTLFAFSEPGIYRVHLRSSASKKSPPVTLIFLAELSPDYPYSTWAESFEKQHGLAPGALANPHADFDRDGVPDGIEFQLFWHGFDPARPDAHLLPKPEFRDGAARLRFLRDLHKDNLSGIDSGKSDSTPLSLSAAYSPNLNAPWQFWLPIRSNGVPDGFYETGAEIASEIGPVLDRELVVPHASPNRAFFRWELRAQN